MNPKTEIVIKNVDPELKAKFKFHCACQGKNGNMSQDLIRYIKSVAKDITLPFNNKTLGRK